MNPLAGAVAGLIGAFEIYKWRVDGLTESLSQSEYASAWTRTGFRSWSQARDGVYKAVKKGLRRFRADS